MSEDKHNENSLAARMMKKFSSPWPLREEAYHITSFDTIMKTTLKVNACLFGASYLLYFFGRKRWQGRALFHANTAFLLTSGSTLIGGSFGYWGVKNAPKETASNVGDTMRQHLPGWRLQMRSLLPQKWLDYGDKFDEWLTQKLDDVDVVSELVSEIEKLEMEEQAIRQQIETMEGKKDQQL